MYLIVGIGLLIGEMQLARTVDITPPKTQLISTVLITHSLGCRVLTTKQSDMTCLAGWQGAILESAINPSHAEGHNYIRI